MCTSIVSNKGKTVVGWNLDLLGMEHRVVCDGRVCAIEIFDEKEGWMPIFGANARGEFSAMPTCWPYDRRSDPSGENDKNVVNLCAELVAMTATFKETVDLARAGRVVSVPGTTFQAQLSSGEGAVLQIVPGQGTRYIPRPTYEIMTNFSPFKGDRAYHPWMGLDRYEKAKALLEGREYVGVWDCFEILRAASQTVCPTVVSMVFDVSARTVYYCLDRDWNRVTVRTLSL